VVNPNEIPKIIIDKDFLLSSIEHTMTISSTKVLKRKDTIEKLWNDIAKSKTKEL